MDTPEIGVARLKAGKAYLTAIKSLGLDPDALCWAFDSIIGHFVLVLITPMFDFKGPYEISKLLFRAYNLAGTPEDIDPFIIRLHSPDHNIIRMLLEIAGSKSVQAQNKITGKWHTLQSTAQKAEGGGLEFRNEWIYQYKISPKQKSLDLSRKWSRFAHNIDRLAA